MCFGEIVAIVGVAHNDELAARRRNARLQSGTIPALRDPHNASATRLGDFDGPVGGTVVSYDDFSRQTSDLERADRLVYTDAERVRLIQARNDNRNFDFSLCLRRYLGFVLQSNFHSKYSSRLLCRG